MFGIRRLKGIVEGLNEGRSYDLKRMSSLEYRIVRLEWQLENPPEYKIGDKDKCLGECIGVSVKTGVGGKGPYSYQYAFKASNGNVSILER